MDYKELINILRDENNPNVLDYIDDAAIAINDLLARAESAESRAEKAEKERDAAVDDLRIFGHCCSCCKWFNAPNCKAKEPCGTNDNWEWRGLKEE